MLYQLSYTHHVHRLSGRLNHTGTAEPAGPRQASGVSTNRAASSLTCAESGPGCGTKIA